MALRRRARVLIASLLAFAPATLAAQAAAPLGLSVGPAAQGWPATITVGPILADPGLQSALDSALPLRFHLRIELWRKGFLDRLEDAQEISLALIRDPLDGHLTLEQGGNARALASLPVAEAALREALRPELRPLRSGRYYYLATLVVETLSLSDLEELRRWLRGEVGPAIDGLTPPSEAIARGVRRLMVRVIGLPTRRFEARTDTFTAG